MPRPLRTVACAAAGLAAVLATSAARANPQLSMGVTVGGEIEDVVGPVDASGAFHLGGRSSLLFMRNRGSDMGLGIYGDIATASFHNVDLGAGGEWLLPIRDDLPIVLSAGGFLREGSDRTWAPGVEGTLWWGSRSYNFHSLYGIATGIFVQSRWVPESPATMDLVIGVQLDAELLLLPGVFIFEAIQHARD